MILKPLELRHWLGPDIKLLETCTWKLNHWKIMGIAFDMPMMI